MAGIAKDLPGNETSQRLSGGRKAFSVTPNDSVDLTHETRAVLVGGAGNINGILTGDTSPVVFTGLTAGSMYPLRFKRIYSTSTTATNLVGIY